MFGRSVLAIGACEDSASVAPILSTPKQTRVIRKLFPPPNHTTTTAITTDTNSPEHPAPGPSPPTSQPKQQQLEAPPQHQRYLLENAILDLRHAECPGSGRHNPRLPAALVDAKVHRTDRSPNFGAPSGVPAARRPPRKDRPLTAKKEISAASSNVHHESRSPTARRGAGADRGPLRRLGGATVHTSHPCPPAPVPALPAVGPPGRHNEVSVLCDVIFRPRPSHQSVSEGGWRGRREGRGRDGLGAR